MRSSINCALRSAMNDIIEVAMSMISVMDMSNTFSDIFNIVLATSKELAFLSSRSCI